MVWSWGARVVRERSRALRAGRPGRSRMLLALPLLLALGKCDFTMVSGETLEVTAVDVCRSGGFVLSVHSFSVKVKKRKDGRYPYRLHKARIVTYLDRNGHPGFQPPVDVVVSHRGAKSDIAQGYLTIGSLSNRSSNGMSASHWLVEIETDADSNRDGRRDVFTAYGDFGS